MLVAPTEPTAFNPLGPRSMQPEDWGVDFLWWVPRARGWGGVQRKTVKDLIASARDGRLVKEIGQMAGLHFACLVIEGKVQWVNDQIVVSDWEKFTREEYLGILFRFQAAGVKVAWTDSTPQTVDTVGWLERWSRRDDHATLTARPSPPTNSWGTRTSKDYGMWVLQSFPGVGKELAERIWDHFGEVPLGWKVTEEELCQVKGLGKVKAQRMIQALGSSGGSPARSG